MRATDRVVSLSTLLGSDRCNADPDTLQGYATDSSGTTGPTPSLLVRPRHRNEVIDLVRYANAHGTSLVPLSSGPPHCHGDTVPGATNAVIVDCRDMNRILRIDPLNRSVMIEPGVHYGELVPALAAEGLRCTLPLAPRGNKSVLTSCLEREARLIPKYQYDAVDPLLTLEVVYGTGDDFRTGSACGPGTLDELRADKVNPWGPGPIDFFRLVSGAQGTLGLVTWANIKTEVLPPERELYLTPGDDLARLIAPVDQLLRRRVVDECLIVNAVTLAALLARDGHELEALRTALPRWTLITGISGLERRPRERLAILGRYLREILGAADLEPLAELPGMPALNERLGQRLDNPCGTEPYWKFAPRGGCRDLFFLTTLHRAPQFVARFDEFAARAAWPVADLGVYLQPVIQGRGCHVEFQLLHDPHDAASGARLHDLFLDASHALHRDGAFFSRPYGPWAELVYRDDPAGVAALRKVKEIFDPRRVLNPGKLCFR
ncbi:MAG: FAD-binding oxidoreductase [Gammaproteobacteria bacterium]|nr:FAD-binding oxidoreductase [Gammaproteobacteria bacterium]